MKTQPYFYNRQIERYLIQFANVFTGFQVRVGVGEREQFASVPVMYGSIDKVVASISAGNTQNKPIRLPIISAYMSGIELAPDLYRGVGQEDRFSYLPSGGVLPDDIRVLHRYMPIPYRITCDLYLYSSNQAQQLALLEQIMVLFDPTMTIQTSDARFDWTKLTTVELVSISLDEPFPLGDADRTLVTKLEFNFPVYITPPAKDKRDEFVEKIRIRLRNLDELLANIDVDDFLDAGATSPGRPFGDDSVTQETMM